MQKKDMILITWVGKYVWPCHPGNRKLYSEEVVQVEYHSFPATLYNISIIIIRSLLLLLSLSFEEN